MDTTFMQYDQIKGPKITPEKHSFKRIMIFGLPGAGKSTFSLKLSQELDLPLYHLDKYYFVEKWAKREKEDFLRIQQSFVEQDSWIIDGNAISSLEMRYKRAHLVLYMCYPRLLCSLRVFKRRIWKDPNILDRPPDCREQIEWALLKYLWRFDKKVASSLEILHKTYPETLFYKITNNQDLKTVLNMVKKR